MSAALWVAAALLFAALIPKKPKARHPVIRTDCVVETPRMLLIRYEFLTRNLRDTESFLQREARGIKLKSSFPAVYPQAPRTAVRR